ncbi:MAG: winged helix-turn-helix domain-containing protein [Theionarchaea archaeon]|nr:winged helix-turn-helix domain-containing protein [Theionarchaea archaeon]
MNKSSQIMKMTYYYRIYEHLYEVATMSIQDIAENTGLSRITVSKYMKDMYS